MFQNREQNYQHIGKCSTEYRRQVLCISGILECPIAGVQHRSVWLGLHVARAVVPSRNCNEHIATKYDQEDAWVASIYRNVRTWSRDHFFHSIEIVITRFNIIQLKLYLITHTLKPLKPLK